MTLIQVRARIDELLEVAFRKGFHVPTITKVTECRGRAAGWCKYNPATLSAELRFNVELLNENPSEWDDTIIHELAHAIAPRSFGSFIRPHGREWKAVCRALGGTGNTRHSMDVKGHRARRTRVYVYDVRGTLVELGATRHKRLQRREMVYRHTCAGRIEPDMFTGKSILKV